MEECGYLEGCYNDTRMICWFCSEPICGEHSNCVTVPVFLYYQSEWVKRRRRVCDDCLAGEVRP
jgi:hypothetical protein